MGSAFRSKPTSTRPKTQIKRSGPSGIPRQNQSGAPEPDYTLDFASLGLYTGNAPPLAMHFSDPNAPSRAVEDRAALLADATLAWTCMETLFGEGSFLDRWVLERGFADDWTELFRGDPVEALSLLPEACAFAPDLSEQALAFFRFFAVSRALWMPEDSSLSPVVLSENVAAEDYNGETLLIFTLESDQRLILYFDGARGCVSGFSMSPSFYRLFFPG